MIGRRRGIRGMPDPETDDMGFPRTGRSSAAILDELVALKADDVDWQDGKVFAYVYDAGPEAMRLLKDAFSMYLTENGLDPTSFPSARELENRIIGAAIELMQGGPGARGTFTSGGTESILLSVKTARDYARAERPGITRPELLLPETAHPAFFKAAQYFDLVPVVVPVDPATFRAVPAAMAAAITTDTVLMAGSAPSYAHGAVDPIEELGEIALRRGLLFHVDCCVGGMYLPFARKLGCDVPRADLAVPGVTQLSMDFHKWGYAAKGASAILYNDGEAMRRHQIFAWSGWTGYSVINPTVLSTRGAGPLAACWAILNFLGEEGYLRLVDGTQRAAEAIRAGLRARPDFRILGDPKLNLFAFTSDTVDLFALSEEMKTQGWYLQPQFGFAASPANLHLSVGHSNVPQVDALFRDLDAAVARLKGAGAGPMLRELPAGLAELLAAPAPEVLDQVAALLGAGEDGVPGRMDQVNNLMNLLPFAQRDELLKEFVNRIYAAR
jgi:glutamate/tyrosine decarboxylase-like PLP-dependent enzyme